MYNISLIIGNSLILDRRCLLAVSLSDDSHAPTDVALRSSIESVCKVGKQHICSTKKVFAQSKKST